MPLSLSETNSEQSSESGASTAADQRAFAAITILGQ
jgi:hypothetical protein